ncbi:MAG: molecular chaperone TorD family protein [Deltaproteobacteria bacterium]|nr:molecular chaperone TorD family protein [Deltaproteobacteria bacterium]
MEMELVLERQEAVSTGARGKLYALVGQGFCYPTEVLYELVSRGKFLSEAQEAVSQLPYRLALEGDLGSGLSWESQQFKNQYTWLFDVGGPNPNSGEWEAPCSLYEGEYGGGHLKTMDDALRFYHHFGLNLSQQNGERYRPDHLATELEFLHALTFKEAELVQAGKGAGASSSCRRVQRDFLRFHLGDFLPRLAGEIVPRGISFYSDLARLGDQFCQADFAYLKGLVGET